MAGIKSGFITGSRAIIKIDSKVVGFAVDVSYDIRVDHIPIETIGKYEVHANEPVAYYVSGSFSVVRYTKDDGGKAGIQGMTDGGNGGIAISHTDPGSILASKSFNLDVYEKTSLATTETKASAGTEKNESANTGEAGVFRLQDCRITGRRGSVNKRSVLMDQFTFVGIIAGDLKADADDTNVSPSNVTPGEDGAGES